MFTKDIQTALSGVKPICLAYIWKLCGVHTGKLASWMSDKKTVSDFSLESVCRVKFAFVEHKHRLSRPIFPPWFQRRHKILGDFEPLAGEIALTPAVRTTPFSSTSQNRAA
ncbi:hypothetical protein BaRGS_00030306, partial [Batillaria attramentaria]